MSQPQASDRPLAAWTALRASGAAMGALVTLVRAEGGTSRTLGTQLAVCDDGRTFGSVTVGGCADGRALAAAARVLETGRAERLTVPLSEEDALALGLGCAGDVDLLVDRVGVDEVVAMARTLDDAVTTCAQGEAAVLMTSIDSAPRRLLVRADGRVSGSEATTERDTAGVALAREVLRGGGASTGLHEAGGTTWFLERLAPVRTLLIVGATEIAAALCAFAAALGWRTVLLDPRDEVLAQPRFAAATERIASIPANVVARLLGTGAPALAVVVVAHDYRVELPVLRSALAGNAPYVGMLGSRRRGAAMRETLAADGVSADQVARLRTPIGLDIGAQGPVEIAVSIVAELIATWRAAPPAG